MLRRAPYRGITKQIGRSSRARPSHRDRLNDRRRYPSRLAESLQFVDPCKRDLVCLALLRILLATCTSQAPAGSDLMETVTCRGHNPIAADALRHTEPLPALTPRQAEDLARTLQRDHGEPIRPKIATPIGARGQNPRAASLSRQPTARSATSPR